MKLKDMVGTHGDKTIDAAVAYIVAPQDAALVAASTPAFSAQPCEHCSAWTSVKDGPFCAWCREDMIAARNYLDDIGELERMTARLHSLFPAVALRGTLWLMAESIMRHARGEEWFDVPQDA